MAEPHLTMRRVDSPCLFSTGIGLVSAAPTVHFRQLCAGHRAFFEICTSDSRLRTTLAPATSGAIVTIESQSGAELRVTTSNVTGRLTATAE